MSSPARAGVPLTRRPAVRAGVPRRVPTRPARAPVRPGGTRRPSRPPLRLVPPSPVSAPRTPFVLLVLFLLGGGLVALLLLNAAGVSASGHQNTLRRDTASLDLRAQQLQREVAALEAPDALSAAARKFGMIPGGPPVFLVIEPDGSSRVVGTPTPAAATPDGSGG